MYDYIRILQATQHAREETTEDECSHPPFLLRKADQFKKAEIGYPPFVYDRRTKVEGLVPRKEDQKTAHQKRAGMAFG